MQQLVTLTTVRVEQEAQILKACLGANGIRCFLASDSAVSVVSENNPLTNGAVTPLSGIQLQVAAQDLEPAQEFLRNAQPKPKERRKEQSPLAAWIAHIERGLRNVPLPLRIILMLFGSVYLAGTLGLLLSNLLQKLP